MIGFKQQAHRWTKGSVQTAIKLLPRILRSRHLSLGIKTEAFFHLTNTVVYPLMVLLTLLIYPVYFGYALNVVAPLKDPTWGTFPVLRRLVCPGDMLGQHVLCLWTTRIIWERSGVENAAVLAVLDGLGHWHRIE